MSSICWDRRWGSWRGSAWALAVAPPVNIISLKSQNTDFMIKICKNYLYNDQMITICVYLLGILYNYMCI